MVRVLFLPPRDLFPAGRLDVIICAALKFLIYGLLGSLLSVTLRKTLLGLKQAQDALGILNAILMRWTNDRRVSLVHFHTWNLVRESILRNDVKNILDRSRMSFSCTSFLPCTLSPMPPSRSSFETSPRAS
ncbi:unnamed protein product [Symbiodinium natans]|uniref:Uncharacterized protein n=1 Tax=Symbiodinium natans TaxID=878477 RepID=A0A812TWY9_9DINO|nr:unnamed protein product [Symbiodinium natans]